MAVLAKEIYEDSVFPARNRHVRARNQSQRGVTTGPVAFVGGLDSLYTVIEVDEAPASWFPGGSFIAGDFSCGEICYEGETLFNASELGLEFEILTIANSLAVGGKIDSGLDVLYQSMNDHMKSGRFDQIDALLTKADPKDLHLDLCIGLLATTVLAKLRLAARQGLYAKVSHKMEELGETPEVELIGLK